MLSAGAATFGIGNVGIDGGQPNDNIRAFACGSDYRSNNDLLAMVA